MKAIQKRVNIASNQHSAVMSYKAIKFNLQGDQPDICTVPTAYRAALTVHLI